MPSPVTYRSRHPMCIWSTVMILAPPLHKGPNSSTSQWSNIKASVLMSCRRLCVRLAACSSAFL